MYSFTVQEQSPAAKKAVAAAMAQLHADCPSMDFRFIFPDGTSWFSDGLVFTPKRWTRRRVARG